MIRHALLALALASSALVPASAVGAVREGTTEARVSSDTALAARTAPAPTARLLTTKRGDYTNPRTQIAMAWKPLRNEKLRGYRFGYTTKDQREPDRKWKSPVLRKKEAPRPFVFTTLVPGVRYKVFVQAVFEDGSKTRTTLRKRTARRAPSTSTTVKTPDSSELLGLPKRVTAVYWSNWNSQISINQVPRSYNLLYLFAAPRGSAEGSVTWNWSSPTRSQIDTVRGRGQRVVLSTGGAGNGIDFHSRSVSRNFVDSIVAINRKFGGTLKNPKIDGVDFNTFEADAVPNTAEYLWMFGELKRLFGSNFIITSPPAPWKSQDKAMIKTALARGLMDYAAPQYYDGPGLAEPSYITDSVRDWVQNVAGGDARKISVGFGMENLPNYSTVSQIQNAWDTLENRYPKIRGAFLWQHRTDYDRGWAYSKEINPRVAR